jgi:hypothetical protein
MSNNILLKTKICCNCQILKKINEFSKDKSRKDGLRPECKECKSKRDITYRKNNIEKVKEINKIYCEKNAEKQRVKAAKWYDDNKKSNINFQIRKAIKSRMRKCNINDYTDKASLKYLDCSIDYFQKWIEFQFDNTMNWTNHGSYWHFDHVKPCSIFDFDKEEDIVECFNWKNIRPLESNLNHIKYNNIDISIINEHNKIINQFLNNSVPNIIGNNNMA